MVRQGPSRWNGGKSQIPRVTQLLDDRRFVTVKSSNCDLGLAVKPFGGLRKQSVDLFFHRARNCPVSAPSDIRRQRNTDCHYHRPPPLRRVSDQRIQRDRDSLLQVAQSVKTIPAMREPNVPLCCVPTWCPDWSKSILWRVAASVCSALSIDTNGNSSTTVRKTVGPRKRAGGQRQLGDSPSCFCCAHERLRRRFNYSEPSVTRSATAIFR